MGKFRRRLKSEYEDEQNIRLSPETDLGRHSKRKPRSKRKRRRLIVIFVGLGLIAVLIMTLLNIGIGQTISRELGLRTYTTASKHNPNAPTKKKETVYVDTYASGDPYSTVVDVVIKNNKETKTIVDRTDLTELNNYEGGEEYIDNGDGTVTWDTPEGQDIKYEGISDTKNLPVDMKVKYYLDGEKISGEKLQGKSGKVKIVIRYKNNLTEEVNGEDTIVPVICMVSMVVTDKSFKRIKISNGKTINTGSMSVLMGIAAPGLAKASGSGTLEDISFDKIVITGIADNFDGQEIMTMVSTDLLNFVDKKTLNKLNVDKKINKLDKSTQKIINGSKQLSDGVATLDEKYKDLAEGTQKTTDGSEQLNVEVKASMTQMSEATYSLAQAMSLATFVNSLETTKLEEIYSHIESAGENYDTASDFMRFWENGLQGESGNSNETQDEKVSREAQERKVQTTRDRVNYKKNINQYSEILKYIEKSNYEGSDMSEEEAEKIKQEAISMLKHFEEKSESCYDAMYNLSDDINGAALSTQTLLIIQHGSNSDSEDKVFDDFGNGYGIDMSGWPKRENGHYCSYNEMLQNINDGIAQLNEDTNTNGTHLINSTSDLAKGMNQVNDGTKTAQKGIRKINKGSTKLYRGMSKYYNKGIGMIVDKYNDALRGVATNLKKVKKAGTQYTNYSGITDDMTGSVNFMYFTPIGNYF